MRLARRSIALSGVGRSFERPHAELGDVALDDDELVVVGDRGGPGAMWQVWCCWMLAPAPSLGRRR
jgi:hypothetical protein